MMRIAVVGFVLLSCLGVARADVADLILLDDVEAADNLLLQLSEPVLDADGTAYWHAAIDYAVGGDILMSSNGPLATDPRTAAEVGDFPLHPQPTDAQNGNVLLFGTYVAAGFSNTAAIYQYPGLARVAYYGSDFPGFTSDPIALQIAAYPLYDTDGSIYFGMRRQVSGSTYVRTICRASGGAIEILVQTGVSAVPATGGATFTSVLDPVVRSGVVLFYGEGGGRRGVYQWEGGTITTVVDDQTTLPPNANPTPLLDRSDVAYANDGHDIAVLLTEIVGGGVWKRIGGQWSRVVANDSPIPGGVGSFQDLQAVAIRDGKVVFLGGRSSQFSPPRQSGLYTDSFGGVVPVVDLDTAFGHAAPVDFDVAYGGRWFDGTHVAFLVESGSWRELYRATPVPGPGSGLAGVAVIATLVALRGRPRPRRGSALSGAAAPRTRRDR
jgi:hypothetical protein